MLGKGVRDDLIGNRGQELLSAMPPVAGLDVSY